MEVAMETRESAKFENKKKMADSQLALSNEIVFDQLKQNAKNKITTKSTQTCRVVECVAKMGK